ncbi:MAG: DUF4825 domain-containing protein [Firmicutes bacterium]|nr:DUF4825 domain-containing protein [Bacillota bacterium]
MKNDLSCAVVRDLLPSYIDKLTSEETNEAVERHLEGCEDCRKVLAAMQGEGGPAAEENKAEAKEIDYLKKVRTGTWKRVIAGILAAAFVFGAGAWIKLYRIGSYVDPSAVNINCISQEHGIAIDGSLKDKSLGVTHADLLLREDGTKMELGFRAAKKGGKDNDFFYAVGAEGAAGEAYRNIQEIWLGDRIVWYQGTLIDEQTAAVWNARHAYVGDMPANAALADALGIREKLGPYTNELQTSEKPYSWTITLENEKNYHDASLSYQLGYATILLATIDNLDSVTFAYSQEGVSSLTITTEMVTEQLPVGVKDLASDPAELQYWMGQFGLL